MKPPPDLDARAEPAVDGSADPKVFIYRAAVTALAAFVSALVGFGAQRLMPAAYVVESKGMVGSVVTLVGSLLSLVLSLLIWTSRGLFADQGEQLQMIARSIVRLDFVFGYYGDEAAPGRTLLRDHIARIRASLWSTNADSRSFIFHDDLPEDVRAMRVFLASLRPISDDQRRHLAAARDLFGTIVETRVTMIRGLADRVPNLLLNVVLGWSCVLFFGYGLMSACDALTILLAALGAVCVASAVFLILELSDPYSGLFRMPADGFDQLIGAMVKIKGADRLPLASSR
jgi:Protein of unknown function (DUF4239)